MTRKINERRRTAAFCWSPGQELVLAAGTLSGTLDDTLSSASELELFKLSTQQSFKVPSQSRFSKIVWSQANKSDGIIAAAKENGELELWNPTSIFNNRSQDALISTHSAHSGTLRSLDFNRLQTNLLATAGSQIYIWDLENTSAPYLPGARSSKMEEMTDVAWNCQVQHILATSASNGYTVVWDLRNKKEILTLSSNQSHSISSIAWHPSVATQIVTASDDEAVISLWDLRHAHAPERTLANPQIQGGILDVSWCRQDVDLLLSSGKDGKTLCWNPNKGNLLGEIHTSSKWAHQVEWCPRNPDLLATASVDGLISVHSIQGSSSSINTLKKKKTTDNLLDAPSTITSSNLELKTPPKWLRRPVGASFGFSGKLVTFKGSSVKITTCATNPEIIKRSEQLVSAENEASKITELIEQRIEQHQGDDKEWRMLGTLFSENAREQLVCHLGFEKEQVMTEANRLLDTSLAEKEEADVPTGSPDAREDMFGIPSLSTLPLYSGDSDTDRFITRAIMVGDFEKAVDLCLELERYTDAILLGVCGGQNTLTRARNAYFASQSQPPYLPTLKNIMDNDLRRIVQTVALEEWASALVILCTFAQPKDFGSLCETLGNRLIDKDAALCCYLAAGNLIKVSNIWIEHLEKSKGTVDESTYHLQLQEFIEKMTLFRKAIDYEDTDGDGLTALYKKYCEYAEWMASQGKLQVALKYINLTPMKGNEKISVIRDRVFHACSKWSTRYKEPHFPFERETLVSNTIPQQLSPQTLHSRMENTSDPSNYYIPEYHTNNTQQQSIYSPTTTYKNYIPQPLYSTTAYMIPTNDVPSQEPREWNDPPIIADLNKPSLNQTLVKKTPFVNHQTPTTPPQHGDFTSPAPPSSSYYSARQQPTQLMATPPPPMNAVAPMLKRTQ